MFGRILIANRGEIACRIIRTCRRLDIETVAVYSEADAGALHVELADHAVAIGGAAPSESYLVGERIIEAAKAHDAEAIHPGYGFLSENADFARAVTDAGLVFIGPRPETIEKMGSKAAARALMLEAGVPVVPGYHAADQEPAALERAAREIGCPVMIKAVSGGGGKGMRVVHDIADFTDALGAARREAQGAFGDDRVILERFLDRPRHVEVQVFGDDDGQVVHLFERDCSTQRRYQKVIEEAPAPALDGQLRADLHEAAVTAARAVDYRGAGTVEFIVDAGGAFYFMEMNTRLQVEHPVTEMITGLDLVEWQLRVAAGEPLPVPQEDLHAHGHAIEARIYAEDPARGFLPGSGRLERLSFPPPGPGLRVESGVREGDTISVHYDPMIAKLVVHAPDRARALAALGHALQASAALGPASNIGFLQRLAAHPRLHDFAMHTAWLDRHLDEVLGPAPGAASLLPALAAIALDQDHDADDPTPWDRRDGWRISGSPAPRRIRLERAGDGEAFVFAVSGHDGRYHARHGDDTWPVRARRIDRDEIEVQALGHLERFFLHRAGNRLDAAGPGHRVAVISAPRFIDAAVAGAGSDDVVAPMPGKIIGLLVESGDHVETGQKLVIMEAMKMELTLTAPHAGTVDEIAHGEGEFVEADTRLVHVAVDASEGGA